jgi:hypothetical protein
MINDIESLDDLPPSISFIPDDRILNAIKQAEAGREIIAVSRKDMSHELLDFLWSSKHRYPLLVSGMHEVMQFDWGPNFFIDNDILGKQLCQVQNCRTKEVFNSTVAEFFETFRLELDDGEVLRLKVESFFLVHSF